MTAAQEAQRTCSRCGCEGPLHREGEVEVGCQLAELRTRLAAAEAGLWAVVNGISAGWPIEQRYRIYDAVARGLGGTHEWERGSLSGQFVGLRAPVSPETAQ